MNNNEVLRFAESNPPSPAELTFTDGENEITLRGLLRILRTVSRNFDKDLFDKTVEEIQNEPEAKR